MESNVNHCSGGVLFIGVVSLIENWIKGILSIFVLVVSIPHYVVFVKGTDFISPTCVLTINSFFLEKIHAEIYMLLSIFGIFCSVLLIAGALRKSSGKIIWWIGFQGISIFHQIFFSVDVIYTIYHRVVSPYLITICILVASVLLLYITLEIYFMGFIVNSYQEITEREIDNDNMPQRRMPLSSSVIHDVDVRRVLSDRNNPMQSSIIKLLAELEGNDTTPLII